MLGIFIDLSKAFDTLDHGILLTKLENYGSRGTALALMANYLQGRTQYVSFNGTSSENLSVLDMGSHKDPFLALYCSYYT